MSSRIKYPFVLRSLAFYRMVNREASDMMDEENPLRQRQVKVYRYVMDQNNQSSIWTTGPKYERPVTEDLKHAQILTYRQALDLLKECPVLKSEGYQPYRLRPHEACAVIM